MRREGGWVQWKRNNCPAFERPATDDQLAEPPRVRRAPVAADSVDMFNAELNRLWNNNSDMDAYLRDSGNDLAVPAMMAYLDILAQQLDPENAIEAEYRNSRDPIYAWRALRLAATELLDKLPADTKTAVTSADGARLPSAEHVLASLAAGESSAADAGEQPAASAGAASQDAGTAAMSGDAAAGASPADRPNTVDQPSGASQAPPAQADDPKVPDQMDVDQAQGADENAHAADAEAPTPVATVPADDQAAK